MNNDIKISPPNSYTRMYKYNNMFVSCLSFINKYIHILSQGFVLRICWAYENEILKSYIIFIP